MDVASDEGGSEIVEKSPGDRYIRFAERLGSGASKDVYRAYDTEEGVEVAWNVVSLTGVQKSERNRIVNEVRLLQRLSHPNVISFYGSWVNKERQQVHFITEILSSGTLKQFISKVQVIRWKIAKRWSVQILEGLAYLHSQGVIHRDLKCDNIFINGTSGDLRIGDLGLSRIHRTNEPILSVLGTPEFMAPDMYQQIYDEKVDIYSFGMCMLEIFTKEAPYVECENPAQIYIKVMEGEYPMCLYRIQNEEAREFIMHCLGQPDNASGKGKYIRPSASELLQHPFLKTKSTDGEIVLVEPPESSSDEVAERKTTGVPNVDKKVKEMPRIVDTETSNTISMSTMGTAVSQPTRTREGEVSEHIDEEEYLKSIDMPASQARKVKVMAGRNKALVESGEDASVELQTQRQQRQGMTSTITGVSDASGYTAHSTVTPSIHTFSSGSSGSTAVDQTAPFDVITQSSNMEGTMEDVVERQQAQWQRQQQAYQVRQKQMSLQKQQKAQQKNQMQQQQQQRQLHKQQQRYLLAAAVLVNDEDHARAREGTMTLRGSTDGMLPSTANRIGENTNMLKLVVTLPIDGEAQNVQFDFSLINDDPIQVAKEMVEEFGMPSEAVLEISETIASLASGYMATTDHDEITGQKRTSGVTRQGIPSSQLHQHLHQQLQQIQRQQLQGLPIPRSSQLQQKTMGQTSDFSSEGRKMDTISTQEQLLMYQQQQQQVGATDVQFSNPVIARQSQAFIQPDQQQQLQQLQQLELQQTDQLLQQTAGYVSTDTAPFIQSQAQVPIQMPQTVSNVSGKQQLKQVQQTAQYSQSKLLQQQQQRQMQGTIQMDMQQGHLIPQQTEGFVDSQQHKKIIQQQQPIRMMQGMNQMDLQQPVHVIPHQVEGFIDSQTKQLQKNSPNQGIVQQTGGSMQTHSPSVPRYDIPVGQVPISQSSISQSGMSQAPISQSYGQVPRRTNQSGSLQSSGGQQALASASYTTVQGQSLQMQQTQMLQQQQLRQQQGQKEHVQSTQSVIQMDPQAANFMQSQLSPLQQLSQQMPLVQNPSSFVATQEVLEEEEQEHELEEQERKPDRQQE